MAEKEDAKVVRQPVFAGSWYPGDSKSLDKAVESYFSSVDKIDFSGKIRAVIVPHAGYAFSGGIAASAFRQLNCSYETVFILGPSHQYPLSGVALPCETHFATPLGEVRVSSKAAQLLKDGFANIVPEAHSNEHSLEIEIPFIQKKLPGAEIVPLVVGNTDSEKLKDALARFVSKDDLVVVSADLSHYHPYEEAVRLDSDSIGKMLALDCKGIMDAEIDAPWAVSSLLSLAKAKSWKPYLVKYANSGDITGDKSAVVGYASVVFVEGSMAGSGEELLLSSEEQGFLLKHARETLEACMSGKKKPEIDSNSLTPAVAEKRGCFVTLKKRGELRGCIGCILPVKPLYEAVMDNVINAAFNDPRFPGLEKNELGGIEIEISVLTVPKRLQFSSADDLKSKLRPNVDGVIMMKGSCSSTYLPQVWEQLPVKEELLSSLCMKGGMPVSCWKDKSTEVYTYHAFVFSESDFKIKFD